MPIGEICNREVVIARRKDSIAQTAKLMREYHVGDVVVVEEKEDRAIPVGILTDRDIVVKLIARDVPLDSVLVGDVMSSDVATVPEYRGIWDTIQYMLGRGIRRIVVTDDRSNLVGILSTDDLLELLSGELSDLAKLFTREQSRERKTGG
ncbi:MAG: CBS domain-containing protein [Syntrophorhabdaceae bacterium]|nr:CBS domain-containing protein [Syntrophorhabdaceae bacterium]